MLTIKVVSLWGGGRGGGGGGGGGGAHGDHVILRPGGGHKPCTDVASTLLAIELQLDIRFPCNGLQQKFQHAEYFTCDPLISQPIFIISSNGFSPLFLVLDGAIIISIE